MPTDYVGDALNVIGMGSREVIDPTGEITKKHQEMLDGVGSDPTLSFEERNARIKNIEDSFYRETQRYDERFFDLTSPRGDSPMQGIFEKNPNKVTDTSTGSVAGIDSGSLEGSQTLPGEVDYSSDLTPLTDVEFSDFMGRNPTASITDDTIVSEEELLGAQDPFQGVPVGGEEQPLNPSPPELGQPTLPTGGEETTLPPGGSQTQPFPPSDTTAPLEPTDLPTSTTPPSTSTQGGAPAAALRAVEERKAANDEEMFRLARVMEIVPLNPEQKKSIMKRIQELQGENRGMLGDITAKADKQTTELVQRLEGKDIERQEAAGRRVPAPNIKTEAPA